jgi:hypothetical protein
MVVLGVSFKIVRAVTFDAVYAEIGVMRRQLVKPYGFPLRGSIVAEIHVTFLTILVPQRPPHLGGLFEVSDDVPKQVQSREGLYP